MALDAEALINQLVQVLQKIRRHWEEPKVQALINQLMEVLQFYRRAREEQLATRGERAKCPLDSHDGALKGESDTPSEKRKTHQFLDHIMLTHRIHGTGIYTYIWLIFMVNVGKYTMHGWYGLGMLNLKDHCHNSSDHLGLSKYDK